MKPRTYRPQPNSLAAEALLIIHAAGKAGINSSDLARAIDRDSNALRSLVWYAIDAGMVKIEHVSAPNATGSKRHMRRYVGTPALQPCVEFIQEQREGAPRITPAVSQQPQLDNWLRRAAVTIPRVPLPGFRIVSNFPNL